MLCVLELVSSFPKCPHLIRCGIINITSRAELDLSCILSEIKRLITDHWYEAAVRLFAGGLLVMRHTRS